MTVETLVIYTDGSCLGNPGPGGYAWAILKQDGTILDQDAVPVAEATTNNRMELMGAAAALRALVLMNANLEWMAGSTVEMRLDSQYVLGEMFDHREKRRADNFAKVKNVDLLQELHAAMVAAEQAGFVLQKVWVKGHASDAGNNLVDGAANAAAQTAQARMAAAASQAVEAVAPLSTASSAPVLSVHPASAVGPSPDAVAAVRMLLLLARDPSTTPEDFLREMGHMKDRLGL